MAPIRTHIAPRRFPKAARLRVRRDFLALQRRGKRRYCPHFVVILAPAQGTRSRLGITVTRRFGNAVLRNRMKRLVREFFRSHQSALVPAQDILVIPRAGAEGLTSAQVGEELRKALSLGARTI
ncbi:MAG: ribonuclease P protein component [Candidatus Binatia bacterium]|nr:ribonuclease P protein component [Candidatus Binatia bacterium]